jgi:endonuclease III
MLSSGSRIIRFSPFCTVGLLKKARLCYKGCGGLSQARKGWNQTMPDFSIDSAVRILKQEVKQWPEPIVTKMGRTQDNPFRVLIATILSLRTKDTCTAHAAARLFELADTPQAMLLLPEDVIAKTIYPVGFYHTKAGNILSICHDLLERFGGAVPCDMEALLRLKGVGRKTANLVISQGFRKPAICVDTHVHRISNRWGYVQTKTPEETEMRLREILPKKYWIVINDLLVTFGQNLCGPVSPWCSRCKMAEMCPKNGVTKFR